MRSLNSLAFSEFSSYTFYDGISLTKIFKILSILLIIFPGPTTVPSLFAANIIANYPFHLSAAMGNESHKIYIRQFCYLLPGGRLKLLYSLGYDIIQHKASS